MTESTKPAKQKITLEPTLQNRIAEKLLPIENCCASGCRKCNYGRWLKTEKRTWWLLLNEITKRMPPRLWFILLILSYIAGYFS